MRIQYVFLVIATIFSSSCFSEKSSEQQALGVLTQWLNGCASLDENISDLYDPAATFYTTTGKNLIVGNIYEVKKYFKVLQSFRTAECELANPTVQILDGKVAILSGNDSIKGVKNSGESFDIEGRQTFVLQKKTSGWTIVHHHRSPIP
jgi:ketosteroid isomerase-like protein